MHAAAHQSVERLARAHPEHFQEVRAVEFGARDVNGSVRDCFRDSTFVGVDAFPGKNVDVMGLAHDFVLDAPFDVAFTTEMLEHDPHWRESLRAMVRCLRPGGLLFLTCATTGRGEHGTERQENQELYTPDPSYYRNLTVSDLDDAFRDELLAAWGAEVDNAAHDLYAWGILA